MKPWQTNQERLTLHTASQLHVVSQRHHVLSSKHWSPKKKNIKEQVYHYRLDSWESISRHLWMDDSEWHFSKVSIYRLLMFLHCFVTEFTGRKDAHWLKRKISEILKWSSTFRFYCTWDLSPCATWTVPAGCKLEPDTKGSMIHTRVTIEMDCTWRFWTALVTYQQVGLTVVVDDQADRFKQHLDKECEVLKKHSDY